MRRFFNVVNIICFILFIPFWPIFFTMCRLQAKPCPRCGEKYWTELVGEWDGEEWHCIKCNLYWNLPYADHH